MIDWATPFPYAIIASILLVGLAVYAIIAGKKFIRIILGVELLFMAANLLLLSFSSSHNLGVILADSAAQTFSLIVILIGAVFAIVGIAIDKQLRKTNKTTMIDFDFTPMDLPSQVEEVDNLIEEQEQDESEIEIVTNEKDREESVVL
ncbi:MAG: NADH-quinone oxidoreductase subunit K [Candidatus Thorarchaeota archaeon]